MAVFGADLSFPELLLYVPNSFTPDGDAFNPTWGVVIDGVDVQGFELNGRNVSGIKNNVFINPNDNDVSILKMNPKNESFGCSQKIHY